MFAHLHTIYDPRERWLVGLADLGLSAMVRVGRLVSTSSRARPVQRVLVLRLERIGDLLMTLGALEALRATWPHARIDLVVGSWNATLAGLLPWVDHVETLDVPWLARGGAATWTGLVARARAWRTRRYDLAINLEGDIRSNLLLAGPGAPVRVGFAMAGGGPALTYQVPFDASRHTDENTMQAVREAARVLQATPAEPVPHWPRLSLPASASQEAGVLLGDTTPPARRLIGLHVSGGRAIKQWYPERFGKAIGTLAKTMGAAVVLTGTADERPLVDAARAAIEPGLEVIDLVGPIDLVTLAAVLARLDLYVTGDTGPMHLAAAMGTPIVAVFGVSDPARYAPLAPHRRIVRIDLPCSPCNRVRLPPERCRGHVPDCLEGVTTDAVVSAGLDLVASVARGAGRSGPAAGSA